MCTEKKTDCELNILFREKKKKKKRTCSKTIEESVKIRFLKRLKKKEGYKSFNFNIRKLIIFDTYSLLLVIQRLLLLLYNYTIITIIQLFITQLLFYSFEND